jgi:hypothetical protein
MQDEEHGVLNPNHSMLWRTPQQHLPNQINKRTTIMSILSPAKALLAAAVLSAVAAPACTTVEETDASEDNLTMGTKPWDDAAEAEWSAWIGAFGEGRASGKCTSVNSCLKNPAINKYFSAARDGDLKVFADCADLPVELRAYFAVATGRPFQYVSQVEGDGDPRYGKNIHPTVFKDLRPYSSLQSLFTYIANNVQSGFYRMAGSVPDGDTYPIDISRATLKPGTVFYDPNGHVLLVYKVEANGTVRMMDGHPDNSLSFGILSQKFAVGGVAQGGGFRNFRPYTFDGDKFTRKTNAQLTNAKYGFSATAQYGKGKAYYDWVRDQLSNGAALEPVGNFKQLTSQLCEDLKDRSTAVSGGLKLANTGPGVVPPNIYGADGDWETFSTPSRDARFKASLRGLRDFISESRALVDQKSPKIDFKGSSAQLGAEYKSHWQSFAKSCSISYTNSKGAAKALTIADIETRVYDLSFDPYHCVELRWGAKGDELASCPSNSGSFAKRYSDERRQRNAIDREYGNPTPFTFGPETPEEISVSKLVSGL